MSIGDKNDNVNFSIIETWDEELCKLTIMVEELPVYGEGDTREDALDDLLASVVEYCSIYSENIEFYQQIESDEQKTVMAALLICKDKDEIRKLLSI